MRESACLLFALFFAERPGQRRHKNLGIPAGGVVYLPLIYIIDYFRSKPENSTFSKPVQATY